MTTSSVLHLPGRCLSADEAAQYLNLSRQTLDNWRPAGKGPPYCRLEGRVVYRLNDLDAWLESRREEPGC